MIVSTQIMKGIVLALTHSASSLLSAIDKKALDFPTRKLDKLTLSCSTLLIFFKRISIYL